MVGDGEFLWKLVLLGATGAGKSSLGNCLLEREAFKVGHGATTCTVSPQKREGVISFIGEVNVDIPLAVIDTPGGKDRGILEDEDFVIVEEDGNRFNLKEVASVVDCEGFVNAFLLVVNGAAPRFDLVFGLLKAYVYRFGTALFGNMIVVVTHWEMSARAQERRNKAGISEQQFVDSWLAELRKHIDTSSFNFSIPFEFIDTEVFANPTKVEEQEVACFEGAKSSILSRIVQMPLYQCARSGSNANSRKKQKEHIKEQGYIKCRNCSRFFYPSLDVTENNQEMAVNTAKSVQAAITTARLARVFNAVAHTPRGYADAAVKAMTRGWNANYGVHFFGKFVTGVGTMAQVGVGAYRVYTANNDTERAQAAIGTGASIAGGYSGASLGATIGTILLPGFGTVILGVAGGFAGAIGGQVFAEKLVGDAVDPHDRLCVPCQLRFRVAEKARHCVG